MYPHNAYTEGLAAEVGKCLHSGYQAYLATQDRDQAVFAMLMDYPFHLNSDPTNYRSVEAAYATLNALMDSVPLMDYEIGTVNTWDGQVKDAIEVPFEIEISGFNLNANDAEPIKILYIGFIDAILFNRISNSFIVVDIKTHRDNSPDLSAKFQYDEQCVPYGLVLEHVLGHSLEGFEVKYITAYVDIEEPKVMLYSFPKGKTEIAEWGQNLMLDLHRLKVMFNQGWFPRNSNACISFKRRCQYFDICSSRDHTAIANMLLQGMPPANDPDKQFKPWIKFALQLGA